MDIILNREIRQSLNSDVSTIQKRIQEMIFLKLDKLIPHKLSEDIKIRCITTTNSLIIHNAYEPFIDRIDTSDEKWINYDNSHRPVSYRSVKNPRFCRITVGCAGVY